jgi:hypothetical protein
MLGLRLFAIYATAIAALRAVVGVERVVRVTDAAETSVCPQGPALDAESASFEGTFQWHSERVPEKEGYVRDEGKAQISGELHLDGSGYFSANLTVMLGLVFGARK